MSGSVATHYESSSLISSTAIVIIKYFSACEVKACISWRHVQWWQHVRRLYLLKTVARIRQNSFLWHHLVVYQGITLFWITKLHCTQEKQKKGTFQTAHSFFFFLDSFTM